MPTPRDTRQPTLVVFSAAEAARSHDFAGFWSNTHGWTTLATATTFTDAQAAGVALPFVQDAAWYTIEQAGKLLVEKIKQTLREDGFDVAQASDGLWYWADEQDRAAGTAGEFPTEAEAWQDLALARDFVLEEAGLDATGVFSEPGRDGDAPADNVTEAPR